MEFVQIFIIVIHKCVIYEQLYRPVSWSCQSLSRADWHVINIIFFCRALYHTRRNLYSHSIYTDSNPFPWTARSRCVAFLFFIVVTQSLRPNRPKRRGSQRKVTRCASWSRLRMNVRGSDAGGRKKKWFISDRRQHFSARRGRECAYSFFLFFLSRIHLIIKLQCSRLLAIFCRFFKWLT